jgi:hypothetical protein
MQAVKRDSADYVWKPWWFEAARAVGIMREDEEGVRRFPLAARRRCTHKAEHVTSA